MQNPTAIKAKATKLQNAGNALHKKASAMAYVNRVEADKMFAQAQALHQQACDLRKSLPLLFNLC